MTTNVHFEIIGTPNEADHTVTARFWTDLLSVEMLGVIRNDDGSIKEARTDLCIGLPPELPLDGQDPEFRAFILRCAPLQWFETLEAKLAGGIGPVGPLLGSMGSLQDLVVREVQVRLDGMARARGYDNVVSLCSYATSKNERFAAEAQHAVDVRDEAWAKCYAIVAAVTSGKRAVPTLEQVLAEMPDFTWPE